MLAVCAPARAQLSNLDVTTLIDELGREEMRDLLIHLSETEKFADPVVPIQLRVAQNRIRFLDTSLPMEERKEAIDNALAAMRECINSFPNHPLRPIWQTDLAEMILTEYLQVVHNSAQIFYEFGVCTTEQKDAFEAAVVEALENLSEADRAFFRLQGELPKQADFVDKYENTGVFDRLMNKYWKLRTQYYLGFSAYYVTLLPNTQPYFTSSANPRVPEKAGDAAGEKRRLLSRIIENDQLQQYANDAADTAGVRAPVQGLLARAVMRRGDYQQALDQLDAVINGGIADLHHFTASLARAWTLERMKRGDQAFEAIDALRVHPLVQSNLLYRMVLVDLKHRLLLARAEAAPAERKAELVNAAYDPYLEALSDPELGPAVDDLKIFVFKRWTQTIGENQDLSQLPAVVPMAIGEMARMEGQNLMVTGVIQPLQQGASDDDVADARAAALSLLNRSINTNKKLLERTDLAPQIRANAMFNLGLATFFTDVNSSDVNVAAAKVFTELADQLTDQPQAVQAIEFAESMLRPLHMMTPKPLGVAEQYEATTNVLFGKFGETTAGDNARLYYAFNVLRPQGRFAEAYTILKRVPFNHPTYWEARREAAYCLFEVYHKSDPATAEEARKAARAEAEQLVGDAAANAGDADQRNLALDAWGNARLILADLALDEGNADEALNHLNNFEQDLAGFENLVRLALAKRIGALVAANRMEDMVRNATDMMNLFPDDAAAVIDQTLNRFEAQIDELNRKAAVELVERTKQQMQERAKFLANAAVRLAQLLRNWAQGQNFMPNEQELAEFRELAGLGDDVPDGEAAKMFVREALLPYEMMYARALRLAGQVQEALQILEPLLAVHPDNSAVIHNAAEAYFATNDRTVLMTKAAPQYDKLIGGLPPPYPPEYWNAWMRRLQINDILNQGVAEIPLRVQQLQMIDPGLGGEPYKTELETLRNKHAR